MDFSTMDLDRCIGSLSTENQSIRGQRLFSENLNPVLSNAFRLILRQHKPFDSYVETDDWLQVSIRGLPLSCARLWHYLPNAFIRRKDAFSQVRPLINAVEYRWYSPHLRTDIQITEYGPRCLDVTWTIYLSLNSIPPFNQG